MENKNDKLLKELEEIKKDNEERKTKIVSNDEFNKIQKNNEFVYLAQMKKFSEFCQSGVCRVAKEVEDGEEEN